MTFNGKAFGQEIVKEVRSFVSKELAPIFKRLDDLEKRFDALPTPKDGNDADLNEVRSMISEALKPISEAVNAIEPAPELPDIPKMIDEAIAARMDVEDMERSIEQVVRAVVAEIPLPEDGKDGAPGADGKDGEPGRDGLDVKDLFRGEGGVLVATMSDGRVKELGQFVGKDGENGLPGKDGSDGIGFDDLSVDYDGEKTVTLRFTKGEKVKEFPLVLPVVIDRGVFSEGKTYSPGDGVTWGGSFWIAQEETGEKPDTAKGWRLAVKKGRDGKDAKSAPTVNSSPIRVTIPKAGE